MKKCLTILALTMLVGSTAYAADQSFNATLKLKAPIIITPLTNLAFPDASITGSAQNITVAPADAGAASFSATGGKNRNITRSVVESSINMNAGVVGDNIAVDTFVLSGPTAFNGSGAILAASPIKVGATAHVLASNADGDYSGTATFRLVYQ